MPPMWPTGGSLGLPADLLIGSDGRVLATKYGVHADDQWSVDELLQLALTKRGISRSGAHRRVERSAPIEGGANARS